MNAKLRVPARNLRDGYSIVLKSGKAGVVRNIEFRDNGDIAFKLYNETNGKPIHRQAIYSVSSGRSTTQVTPLWVYRRNEYVTANIDFEIVGSGTKTYTDRDGDTVVRTVTVQFIDGSEVTYERGNYSTGGNYSAVIAASLTV